MRRATPSQRGHAVVEFALSFSLLWLTFLGVFEYGYTLYLYNGLAATVANAARAAARLELDNANPEAFRSAVQNMVVYGNAGGTGSPVVPNLTPANVSVSWAPDSPTTPPESVTVAITGYSYNAIFQTVTFEQKPRVAMRYVGHYMIPIGGGGGGGTGNGHGH